MVESIFIEILNMSLIASFVILVVMVIRLCIKRFPKRLSYYLWIVPLIRLSVPFSIETILSIIPINPKSLPTDIGVTPSPVVTTGIDLVDTTVNASIPQPTIMMSMNPVQGILSLAAFIWMVGVVVIILYGVYRYRQVGKRVAIGEHVQDNIYRVAGLDTAFVLGIIKPRIYLPEDIEKNELAYILCHEQMHIRRKDHIVRGISYLIAGIHWFNPFVWIAFYLSAEDMEMACDEAVINRLGSKVKKEYSSSLLNITIRNYGVKLSPIAFGEKNPKGRIKNILAYKKPKTYMTVGGIALLVVVSILLLTNPLSTAPTTKALEVGPSQIEEIAGYKTPYVGDNSRVSQIAGALPILREDLVQKYIAIDAGSNEDGDTKANNTELEHHTLTVFYEARSIYGLEDAIETDPLLKHRMDKNALLAFALIDNVDELVFAIRQSPSLGLDVKDYSISFSYERGTYEERYGDLVALGNDIEALQNAYMGAVAPDGIRIYIWRNEDVTGTEDIYYTVMTDKEEEQLYEKVYNLEAATMNATEIKDVIYTYQSGTHVDLNFVNMMPLRIVEEVRKSFEKDLREYQTKVFVIEPIMD